METLYEVVREQSQATASNTLHKVSLEMVGRRVTVISGSLTGKIVAVAFGNHATQYQVNFSESGENGRMKVWIEEDDLALLSPLEVAA